jgi:AcrR family transcriptional regulator
MERERRRPGPVPKISRQLILDAARDQRTADVTMRSLAESLGVTTAALYRYFPSREQLVSDLAREVTAVMPLPEVTDWREWLRAIAIGFRTLLADHPILLDPGTWDSFGDAGTRVIDRSMGVLLDAGFDEATAITAYHMVTWMAYFSAELEHVKVPQGRRRTRRTARVRAAFPRYAQATAAIEGLTLEQAFRTHLEWALAGIPDPKR